MVAHLLQVVTEYDERLRRNHYVLRFSYVRRMLWDDGGPSGFFSDAPDRATCCSPGPRLISASLLSGMAPLNTDRL